MFKKLFIIGFYLFVCIPDAYGFEKSLEKYVERLENKIKANWLAIIPSSKKETLKIVIEFSVQKNGEPGSIQIVKSSFDSDFDQYAIKAFQSSQPFDPLPASYNGNSVRVRFTFDMKVNDNNILETDKKLPPDAQLFQKKKMD